MYTTKWNAIVSFLYLLNYIHISLSFKYNKLPSIVSKTRVRNQADGTRVKDEKLEAFLSGNLNRVWSGTKDILQRRGQVPTADYGPKDVIRICLMALQNNDDPQLDHGACVVLSFKSPAGTLSLEGVDGILDPAGYGRFLRSTDYSSLIDFASAEQIGDVVVSNDGQSVRQCVKITSWGSRGNARESLFDFYLSKIGELWLIDAILKR